MAGEDATNSDNTSNTMKPITPIAQYQCPKLKTTNYTVWAIQIKVILEAHGLWETIEPKEDTEIDNKKDKAMTALLYQAITEDVILQIAGCKTAKELWESLKKRHVGEEKVQQDDDTVDAFTAKLNGYATKAKELRKTLDESLLVRKLLDSTPDRFIQIVASIEQTSDLDNITLDEITGKLKAFKERIKLRKGGQDESQENLLFAQGEHSGKGRRFNKRGGTSTTQEQSNLILEGDDEPSLLMTTHETEHEEVLLNEGQIQPEKYASGDASMWYLDNGASNHMTGVKSHFKDIDESISGREKGIAQQLTTPYSPQQNRVVERRNRTVLSTTRSMMKSMKLPLTFWAEAVRHAIYILNRVPTRALEDKTPYEALYNRKSNLENLRIFGCTAYAKITTPHLKKLDDKSIPLIYLGVEEGSKPCRLYDLITKKKHVSRDVKFMETKPWDWNKGEEDTSTQDTFWTSFMIEGVDNENATPVNIEINDNIDNPYQEQDLINDLNSPITPSTYTYNPHSDEEVEATTSSIENSEKGFDHVPMRGFKKLTDIYQNTQEVETNTLLLTEEEPRNYKKASTDKKWIETMKIELDSINKNNTWILTTLLVNQKAIGLKWVFKTKRDAKGNIIKYKARLEIAR
nr:zinc finger, CCHC-type [Tanacetum cinerariifolium]